MSTLAAIVVLFVLLAVVSGAVALVVLLVRNALRPDARPVNAVRRPPPPDDDKEISARFHH
jgi:hypothetical protein